MVLKLSQRSQDIIGVLGAAARKPLRTGPYVLGNGDIETLQRTCVELMVKAYWEIE